MNQQTTLFSNEKLMAMIIPLFLEQLLIMLVGMADTLVVSYAGEAAVSGVSLVNQFNTIFIYLFTALASGGAVVISQYIGRKKNDDAGESASQLLSFSAIFSILIVVMVLIGNEGMLRLMFGKVEDSVMHSCITYQIAANGVAQSIWSLAALAGVAMGPVFITVIGQCMGNGDADAAEHYFKRLTRITLLISSAWNLLIFLLTPFFMKFYALQPETKRLVIWLVLIHNVFNAAAYPFSGALSNGLRAAGDVKFTMYVSVISTIAVRLLLSWLLGIVLKMGVIGIAIAMVCDWSIRAVIFFWRQKSGKWKTFQVI